MYYFSTSPEEFLSRLSAHEQSKKDTAIVENKEFSLPGIVYWMYLFCIAKGGVALVTNITTAWLGEVY